VSYTVAALHKRLGELIAAGHGRKPVCVNKDTFRHPLEEDGAVILDIAEVQGPIFVCKTDDDGGTKFNQDGSEAGIRTVVLRGTMKEIAA